MSAGLGVDVKTAAGATAGDTRAHNALERSAVSDVDVVMIASLDELGRADRLASRLTDGAGGLRAFTASLGEFEGM